MASPQSKGHKPRTSPAYQINAPPAAARNSSSAEMAMMTRCCVANQFKGWFALHDHQLYQSPAVNLSIFAFYPTLPWGEEEGENIPKAHSAQP